MNLFNYLLLTSILHTVVRSTSAFCVPNTWKAASPDLTMKYVETTADNNYLYGIATTGELYYRTGGENWNDWQLIPDAPELQHMSVSGDGDIFWGITVLGDLIYREGNGPFQNVQHDGKNWIDVSVSADGNHLAALDEFGAVWDRKGINDTWARRTGNLMVVSYTENGEIGWGVDFDHNVWYRGGYLEKWVKVTGNLKFIVVSADGNHVWGANYRDIIFYRKGKNDFWKEMEGRAKQITVSANGSHVYAVNRADRVNYINGYPGFTQYDGKNTRNVGRPMKEISVSGSGNQIYGVDMENNLWHTAGINDPWTPITGQFKSVTVVLEHQLYAITEDDKIRFRKDENEPFIDLNGNLRNIEGSSDGRHIYGTASNNIMSFRPGNFPGEHTFFTPLTTDPTMRANQVSVSADGSHVWYVNPRNVVLYKNGLDAPQETIPGLSLKHVAVSGDGNHVWGIDEEQVVYYRAGRDGTWMKAGGLPAMDYLSVNDDSEVLYGVNYLTGNTYYRFC